MGSPDITSGELLYRMNNLREVDLLPSDPNISIQLREFLDIAGKDVVKRREKSLMLTSSLRPIIDECFSNKVDHLSKQTIPFIRSLQQCIQTELEKDVSYSSALLHKNTKHFEAKALESTLQYFSVLKEEIEGAAHQLQIERSEKESLKKQAKVGRDIMLFNQHLRMESRKQIELVPLHPESAQFQRCVRAVHDNLNESFGLMLKPKFKLTAKDVRILNVFKLKNDRLTKQLQENTAKVKNAKLKGLFCCLPSEALYSFAVHGISDQLAPESVQSSLLKQKSNSTLSSSWLFANGTPLLPLPDDLQNVYNIAGAAQKLVNRCVERPHIRFSRFSTISSVAHYSEKQIEKGVILALCRVLIVKQKIVTGFVEDSSIVDAHMNGYDAIMSSLNEEYVLLNPSLVVPEFFIHVFFPTVLQHVSSSTDSFIRNCELSIPDLFVPPNNEIDREISWDQQLFLRSGENNCFIENILAGNDLHHKGNTSEEVLLPHLRGDEFNSQRNVVVKQTALVSIENAAEEFNGIKNSILKNLSEKASTIVKSKLVSNC